MPQTPRVSPKSSAGTLARLGTWSETRIRPPTPATLLTTNLPVSWADRLSLPWRTQFTNRTGNWALSNAFVIPLRTGRGTILAYPCAIGRSAYLVSVSLKANMVRLKRINGSFAFCPFANSSVVFGREEKFGIGAERFPEAACPENEKAKKRIQNIGLFMTVSWKRKQACFRVHE